MIRYYKRIKMIKLRLNKDRKYLMYFTILSKENIEKIKK